MEKKNKNNIALTGGAAAAEALRQIEPDVMPIYPITPQTPIIETYAKFQANGLVDTEIIRVESEHSAISAAVGASAAGARTVTATSSQGLALMHEILYITSGLRLPILLVISARALSAPINIHGDHSDVMGARDSGWIQLFCENAQEAYDKTLIGMKLAERVKMPAMVIMDGFNTSHSVENLKTMDDQKVKKFIGELEPVNPLLDVDNPVTYGPVALQNSYFEFRIDEEKAMQEVFIEYEKIAQDFEKISHRKYDYFETYQTEGAEKIMVMAGTSAGTAKVVINKLRKQGEKVGILKINLFRPFPYQEIAEVLKDAQEIIVLDRAQSIGSKPPIYSEVISALFQAKKLKKVKSCVYGLGGRDLFQKQIEDILTGKNQEHYLT